MSCGNCGGRDDSAAVGWVTRGQLMMPLKRRPHLWMTTWRCSMRFQTLLSVVSLACCIGHSTVEEFHLPSTEVAPDWCPLRLRSNVTGASCACLHSPLDEIRCTGGLDAVPQFTPTDQLFHALYLSNQNINELKQGSFTNLQVGIRPVESYRLNVARMLICVL